MAESFIGNPQRLDILKYHDRVGLESGREVSHRFGWEYMEMQYSGSLSKIKGSRAANCEGHQDPKG
jgi:hypothetical protein